MIKRIAIVLSVIIGIGLFISLFIIFPANTVMFGIGGVCGVLLALIFFVALYNYIFHGRFTPSLE